MPFTEMEVCWHGEGGVRANVGPKHTSRDFLLLPATIALSVQTTVVEAASNECKAKPDFRCALRQPLVLSNESR